MNYQGLPEGYELLHVIELTAEPRLARRINLTSLLIALVMTLAALPFVPLSAFVPMHMPTIKSALRLLLLFPALFAQAFLLEWIRGAGMRYFGKVKPKYGFSGIYLYVGSSACFDRRSYLSIIAFPIVLWGIVLMAFDLTLPISWFWFFYILQIVNISGAAGSFYLMSWLSRLPHGILIRDSGERVEIYAPAEKAK